MVYKKMENIKVNTYTITDTTIKFSHTITMIKKVKCTIQIISMMKRSNIIHPIVWLLLVLLYFALYVPCVFISFIKEKMKGLIPNLKILIEYLKFYLFYV